MSIKETQLNFKSIFLFAITKSRSLCLLSQLRLQASIMFINEVIKIVKKSLTFLPPVLRPKVFKHATELSMLSLADFVGLAFLLPVLLLLLNTGKAHDYRLEMMPAWYQYVFLLIVLIFFLLKSLIAFYLQKKQVKLVAKIVSFVSAKNTEKFLNLPYEKRMETDTSLFSEKVYFQPLYLGQGIFVPLFTLFQELVVLIFIVIGMIAFYPYVSVGLMVILLVSGGVAYKWIRQRSISLGEKNIERRKKLFDSMAVNLSGMLDMKQSSAQDKFKESLSSKVLDLAMGELDTNSLRIIPFRVNELISVIGLIMLILYARLMNPTEDFIMMGSIFALALFRLIPAINRIQLNLVQIRLYSRHLNSSDYDNNKFIEEEMLPFAKEIELKNLSLMYSNSGTPILNKVNLNIPKGCIVVFTGESGVGKSSLMRIIAGQMKATEGELLVDGKVLKDNNLRSWQSQIALISQKPYVLKDGIVENVCFGSDSMPDLDKVKTALRQAGLEDFIEDCETRQIGEEGYRISEGQKQRLMLARAIYRRSSILLLDEITANLDSHNTQIIIQTVKTLKNAGHTIILTSHNQEVANIADLYCNFRDRQIFINEYSKSDS